MTTFPGSPRLLKGAIASINLPDPTPNLIVFQYNPATLSRTLQAQTAGGEGDRADATRLKGAPVETINIDIEIDAADQLEKQDDTAVRMGIGPQLASLESLLHPSVAHVVSNLVALEAGVIEIVPPAAPFTLFIYGPRRVLPVSITQFSITEEAHDVKLNPLRARVSLGLRVLTYSDLRPEHPGHALYLANQAAREVMAKIGLVHNVDAVTGGDPQIL